MPADLVFAAAPKLLTPSPLREGAAQFVSPPCAPATYFAPTTGVLQPPSLLLQVEPEPETPAQQPEDEGNEHGRDDSGSWTADDEPVLLRFLLPAGRTVDLDKLEQKFEGAIAQLLGCARDRIAWVGAEDADNGASSVSFCVYAADEDDESQGDSLQPSCATLGQSLIDICESAPERLGDAGLEELAGVPLTDITDAENEEWVDEVPEDAAVELMLGCEPPLAIVRRLFLDEPTGTDEGLQVLRPEHLTALYDAGFCVIDGALDPTTAAAAGLETLALESSSAGGFAQAGLAGHDAKVRDDRTLFLHPERGSISAAVAPASAAALDRAAALMTAVHRDVASAVRLKHGASRPELQLAVYRGAPPTPRGTPGQGARYERHRDGFPSAGGDEDDSSSGPMWRRVTSILYLNESEWPAAHGGALRVYHPQRPSSNTDALDRADSVTISDSTWLDVFPQGGRLVIFMSGAVEHEVLPAYAPRVALTAWFS